MAEVTTQDGTSGAGEGGGEPTPTPASGETGTTDSTADAFAEERAALQAQARDWQGRYDRLVSETRSKPDPTPSPTPTDAFLTKDDFRAELRRQREVDSAVVALKEKFPLAAEVFDKVDTFDNVEQITVAAENAHKRIEALVGSHVETAVAEAIRPYVERFGPIQVAPGGAKPGQGDGLPTLAEVERMSIDEMDALDREHPGLIDRLHRQG